MAFLCVSQQGEVKYTILIKKWKKSMSKAFCKTIVGKKDLLPVISFLCFFNRFFWPFLCMMSFKTP
jgi:hypothetical protein